MVPHGAMNLPQNIKFDVSVSVALLDPAVQVHIVNALLTFNRKSNGRKMKRDGRSGAKVRLFPCLKHECALILSYQARLVYPSWTPECVSLLPRRTCTTDCA